VSEGKAFYRCLSSCTCICHTDQLYNRWSHPHPRKRCADAKRYIIKEERDDPVVEYLEGIRMERERLGMASRSQTVVGSSPMPSATRNTGVG
jgi:hypothetical protein